MDNTDAGNGDRHDRAREPSTRRKTVSGPAPEVQHEADDPTSDPEEMRFPWSSPSAPSSPTSAEPANPDYSRSMSHRRALSNNLLSRFPFLRLGNEEGRPTSPLKDKDLPAIAQDKEPRSPTKSLFSRKSNEDDQRPQTPTSPTKGENVMAAVMKASKTRKRKGSLRKTALLGTRRAAPEGRERKSSLSLLQRPHLGKQEHAAEKQQDEYDMGADVVGATSENSPADLSPPGRHNPAMPDSSAVERPMTASSSDSSWSSPSAVATTRLSLVTSQKAQMQRVINQQSKVSDLGSPLDVKSPASQASYTASTTDEDDVLTFERPAKQFPPQAGSSVGSVDSSSLNNPLSTSATSYFPPPSDSSLSARPRRAAKRSSPLSHSVQMTSNYSEPEPHDYTETEYWGWVILFVTWLTFTVGMGSCLEIWSWAWNVGFKPYAPPELQDDQTLPIVGYYPALIVLTGVVAWAWITVAWVGMKYFRHAKIEV